jgi:hypothetical protein
VSEFSESYHLYTTDQQYAVNLLKRASLKGFVFAEVNHWVTVLSEGTAFQVNEELINANEATLVHLIYAEDHGCSFSIYEGTNRVCHYECVWEEELEVVHDQFDADVILKLMNKGQSKHTKHTIIELFNPDNYEELFDNNPIEQLAGLLDLSNYQWVSYDYVASEFENNPNFALDLGILTV